MNFALPVGDPTARFWRRAATANIIRVFAMCTAFVVLLAAGASSGRDLADMLRAAMSRAAFFGAGTPARPTDALRLADPVAQFPQTRVGHLLFASYNSDFCRRVLFDNRTGATSDAGRVLCG